MTGSNHGPMVLSAHLLVYSCSTDGATCRYTRCPQHPLTNPCHDPVLSVTNGEINLTRYETHRFLPTLNQHDCCCWRAPERTTVNHYQIELLQSLSTILLCHCLPTMASHYLHTIPGNDQPSPSFITMIEVNHY